MVNTLDFTKSKKQYLTIKFVDGITIMVGTPTKKLLDEFIHLQAELSGLNEAEDLTMVYEVCAKLLSCNKAQVPITTEYLQDQFDIEDIATFINGYMEFLKVILSQKN